MENLMWKRLLGILCAMCPLAFADDMTATTVSGAVVILHDNGRWEYYQNNSKVRDIRESAIPKDMQTVITIEYEDIEKLQKDLRMQLEADDVPEDAIRDSLRSLPPGGIVHFCVNENQVHRGNPRTFTYTIWLGKKQIYQKAVSEAEAVPSETANVTYLLSVPLMSKLKNQSLKARVEDGPSSIDFDIR